MAEELIDFPGIPEGAQKFMKLLFAESPHHEQCFRKICGGCRPQELAQLLWATCLIGSNFDKGLVNAGGLSSSELAGLPEELRQMADQIEAINCTTLSPLLHLRVLSGTPMNQNGVQNLKALRARYEIMPGLLRTYSFHLERFARYSKATLKRLTLSRLMVLEFLAFVERSSGRLHYSEASDLLICGWRIARRDYISSPPRRTKPHESVRPPKYLDVEALSKMYQRWGKLMGLKSNAALPRQVGK